MRLCCSATQNANTPVYESVPSVGNRQNLNNLETLQVALVASLLSRPSGDAAGVDVPSPSDVTVATVDSYQASTGHIVLSITRTLNGRLRLLSVRTVTSEKHHSGRLWC